MRVLLLDGTYRPPADGAPIEARRLAGRLAARGIHVDLVTGEPPPAAPGSVEAQEPAIQGLRVHGARRRRGRGPRSGPGGAARGLASRLRVARRLLRARHHHLVHLFYSLPSGTMLPFLPLSDAAVVVSLRSHVMPGRGGVGASRHTARVLRPLTRWIWGRADALVAGCENLARMAEAVDPEEKIDVIRNGVDLELFGPGERDASTGEPPRCLAVGALVERTAVHDLLHAWARLERGACRLEIAGAGKQETRLRGLARALGVESDVVFTGPLDREQIAGRYRAADLFVLCPGDVVCGSAFARALAAGLPVVASRVGGIPELVVNGVNGLLVPPGDPDAIAAAVRRLTDHPALRDSMAAANRARAEALLSWERMGDAYERLYRELLGSRRRISSTPLLVRPRRVRRSAH